VEHKIVVEPEVGQVVSLLRSLSRLSRSHVYRHGPGRAGVGGTARERTGCILTNLPGKANTAVTESAADQPWDVFGKAPERRYGSGLVSLRSARKGAHAG
jgi:hypothetical protein